MYSRNNWYVITGGPNSGKTTLINALVERGFHVEHEIARLYIDEEIARGKALEEIRKDESEFQNIVCRQKLEREQRLPKEEIIFFDRGMQDTSAYNKFYGFAMKPDEEQSIKEARYRKVFLLDPPKYEKDYARIENADEAKMIHELIKAAYEESGNETVTIPVFETKQERIEYFLEYLREKEGLSDA